MIKLFLDDDRFPIEGEKWYVIRSAESAMAFVELLKGKPSLSYVMFDHDLGDGLNGYDFAKWLCEFDMNFNILTDDFDFYVHSRNPIGKNNIECYLNNYLSKVKKAAG